MSEIIIPNGRKTRFDLDDKNLSNPFDSDQKGKKIKREKTNYQLDPAVI